MSTHTSTPQHVFVGAAWPYANGPLHLGHIGGAFLPADIFARYQRLTGNKVLMVSGSDQHGTPITVRAEQEGVTPAEIADRFHASFVDCWQRLGISWDLFTKTTTDNHKQVVQDIFTTLYDKGYIYLDSMQMLHCDACQRFLADRYVEGTCPNCAYDNARGDQCDACSRTFNAIELVSPRCKFCGGPPVVRSAEHFFFRWSAFNEPLLAWVKDIQHWKHNVIHFTRRYLEEGLRDSAISRDMEWGIAIPLQGYEKKRIYVWFEAVIGYLSASREWAQLQGDPEAWRPWWSEGVRSYYFIGKDNIPFHTLRWPAVLLGVGGLPLPYDVPSNEYLTLEHKPFSTSRNWAVWVPDFLDRYDPDPLRYYLSVNMPESSDSDFSWSEFHRRNNDELVATYGNLVHRTLTFVNKHFEGKVPVPGALTHEDQDLLKRADEAFARIGPLLDACSFKEAIREVMATSREGNQYLDTQAPWKMIKVDRERAGTSLYVMLCYINALKVLFAPFLANTSSLLHELLGAPYPAADERWAFRRLEPGAALAQSPVPLFKKLDEAIVESELARLRGEVPAVG
jgi:methionyl-tRNA synthetase